MATAKKKPQVRKNAKASTQNGLGDAIGYNENGMIPFGIGGGEAISSINTIFRNLRFYLVSNMRQPLSQSYVEIAIIQTLIDVPVDDALRGGIIIKSKQLDEQDIEKLQIAIERDDDLVKAGQTLKWMRLFGGAGLLAIVEGQDPMMPFDVSQITANTNVEFRPADLWELFYSKQNIETYDPATQEGGFEFYDYYGEKVHKTRVMPVKGITAPSFIRPRLRGWGMSEVERLVRSINQYLKATDLTFEVLDEFKLDVYKIKNLVNTLLSPNGDASIRKRVQMANWQKNFQNAVVMDVEDEFDHKQLSFSGLKEVMDGVKIQIASDVRMPMTKLFGISSAGFNSGEDDIEVYNCMVESAVRAKAKPLILKMLEIKCQQMFGMIPDDLQIEFKPLRILSTLDEETVKEKKFNRLLQAQQAGLIDVKDFRDAVNKGNLMDVKLDPNFEVIDMSPPEEKTDKKENSLDFDLAAYDADGGDSWMAPERVEFYKEFLEGSKWDKAVCASEAQFGCLNYAYAIWHYKKQGGVIK